MDGGRSLGRKGPILNITPTMKSKAVNYNNILHNNDILITMFNIFFRQKSKFIQSSVFFNIISPIYIPYFCEANYFTSAGIA